MKDKLLNYKQQFESQDVIGFERALGKLRHPLRKIDRSKYIRILDTADVFENKPYESYKGNSKWIQIRFPFNKKTITKLETIAHKYRKKYYHERGTHSHHFELTENIVFDVVNEFKDSNFEIQKEILDFYSKIESIKSNPTNFVPMYKDNSFFNISDKIKKQIEKELNNDHTKIIDRRFRYAIETDVLINANGLMADILNRTESAVLSKPSQYSLQHTYFNI